jgi:hypothetical protein
MTPERTFGNLCGSRIASVTGITYKSDSEFMITFIRIISLHAKHLGELQSISELTLLDSNTSLGCAHDIWHA